MYQCLFEFVYVHVSLQKCVEDVSSAAVASISAGNDEYVGNLIAEAIEKIGFDGVVTIESSSSSETSVVIEEGMKVLMIMMITIIVVLNGNPLLFPRSE